MSKQLEVKELRGRGEHLATFTKEDGPLQAGMEIKMVRKNLKKTVQKYFIRNFNNQILVYVRELMYHIGILNKFSKLYMYCYDQQII